MLRSQLKSCQLPQSPAPSLCHPRPRSVKAGALSFSAPMRYSSLYSLALHSRLWTSLEHAPSHLLNLVSWPCYFSQSSSSSQQLCKFRKLRISVTTTPQGPSPPSSKGLSPSRRAHLLIRDGSALDMLQSASMS